MATLSPSITLFTSLGDMNFVRGNFVLNGTAAVTVSAPQVTANSSINITLAKVGGTVGAYPAIQTITPGVGFTVAGSAGDLSTYNYSITG
ncbi:MAG: hypothetical protein ABSG53_19055 [Thermoguttaceae bacterium]|jgi:hypothetical protein